ncbi:MAG: SPOR domain-containing protein [Cyanobacteria bacterium J06623_7]
MNRYKYRYLACLSLAFVVHSTTAVNAQVKDERPVYLSRNNTREYTFKAPDSKTLTNSKSLTAVGGYKVEVYGNEDELLSQVRNVEPQAFVKGNIIQVGIFSQRNNAEDMVQKLAGKGFWARMITP